MEIGVDSILEMERWNMNQCFVKKEERCVNERKDNIYIDSRCTSTTHINMKSLVLIIGAQQHCKVFLWSLAHGTANQDNLLRGAQFDKIKF